MIQIIASFKANFKKMTREIVTFLHISIYEMDHFNWSDSIKNVWQFSLRKENVSQWQFWKCNKNITIKSKSMIEKKMRSLCFNNRKFCFISCNVYNVLRWNFRIFWKSSSDLMQNCPSTQFKDAHIFISEMSLFQQLFNRVIRGQWRNF